MNRNFPDFSGYVLAGGKSSRMKTDKAFLNFGGETFLEHAARALETICENRVKIVLNRSQTHFIERLPAQIPYLFDVFENRGALGGIHAALSDCQTDVAVILACDMPFVTSKAIEKLAEIAISTKKFSAVVPRQSDGRFQPLCAVYCVEKCLPEVEKYLTENNSNAVKDFLRLVDAKSVEVELLGGDKMFFNVNQPSDFNILIDG